MKRMMFAFFYILLGLTLAGKVLNWIFSFDAQTNQIINTAMFTLVGIAYLVMGRGWDKKAEKAVILICGGLLITTNFLDTGKTITMVRIACLLTPMLIARFSKAPEAA
ncbi:MAG: hypothetical protein EAY75_17590 [Bacteroidetes bacterium]|nr:MAG: hypothetical protein EAY75_17590 [Bacteroidota bacterium]